MHLSGCHHDSPAPPGDTATLLAKTCAFVVSCPLPALGAEGCPAEIQRGIASFDGVLEGEPAQFLRVLDCAANTSSCTDLTACLSRDHGADWCQAFYGVGCDGNVRVVCGASAYLTSDCAAAGEQCQNAGPGKASCTNSVACSPGGPDACDGNRWNRCDPDTRLQSSIDCGSLRAGAVCGTFMGFSECIPAGPACSSFYPLRCDGNSLVSCVSGHEYAVDCTASEAHCVDSGASSACVTNATDCTEGTPYQCSGDSLEICVNGHVEAIDCTKIGMRTCVATPAVVADMGGSTARASCVP
ncbi:MAG: hypothetical protein JWN44_218 [Myxococcales bacterium]|nr:hypothetical protein [Myxococcales bacterium]